MPDLAEIGATATVARLEERCRTSPLFQSYERLCRRFAAGLADARDLALARSAALKLVKVRAEEAGPGADGA